jgi:hypothetical protein
MPTKRPDPFTAYNEWSRYVEEVANNVRNFLILDPRVSMVSELNTELTGEHSFDMRFLNEIITIRLPFFDDLNYRLQYGGEQIITASIGDWFTDFFAIPMENQDDDAIRIKTWIIETLNIYYYTHLAPVNPGV